MLISIFVLIASLGVLVWSSDQFVAGASATSRHMGVSPLIVGMIVVGFGTSAPELLVSILSAIQGSPSLAMGNALGSNISNIGLILGLTALLSPIAVQSGLLKQEMPILLIVTVLAGGLFIDGDVSRFDSVVLLVAFVFISGWLIWRSRQSAGDVLAQEAAHFVEHEAESLPEVGKSVAQLAFGLVLLIVSSKFLVDSAVDLAQAVGVSDLVIGLTIVAVGTSLPELASSIAAVRRNEHDMALGNVIGSNLFNLMVAVGAAGAIQPFVIEAGVMVRDYAVVLIMTALLYVFCVGLKGKPGRVNRLEGAALLLAYAGYMAYLLYSSLPAGQ